MKQRSVFILMCLSIVSCKNAVNPQAGDSDISVIEGIKAKPDDLVSLSTVSISHTEIDPKDPKSVRYKSLCTGTYIGENTIITATHCLAEESNLCKEFIYWGTQARYANPKKDHTKIKQFIKHKKYSSKDPDLDYKNVKSKSYDIGIIKFEGKPPLRTGRFPWQKPPQYRPVKFVEKSTKMSVTDDAIIAGFGVNDHFDFYDTKHSILMLTPIKITDYLQAPKHIIAQHEISGAAYGDSGGPLYKVVGKELELMGITIRTGSGFGATRDLDLGLISIFEDVREHYDWFQKNSGVDLRTNKQLTVQRTDDAVVTNCN